MDQHIAKRCHDAIAGHVFPGCQVSYIRSDAVGSHQFGQLTYEKQAPAVTEATLYEVASVTKSIPTSSLILKLIEEGKISLDDRVIEYLPELTNEYREEILIRHLLTFTVAFNVGGSLAELARKSPDTLLPAIFNAPLLDRPGHTYLYTNVPSLLLGIIAERVCGQTLDTLAWERFFGPLGMSRTAFKPVLGPDPAKANVAPTAVDERGEVRGHVHDPGAWALSQQGLVPGHAGLFSTADDLLKFAAMLLAGGTAGGRRFFQTETVESMHTNQLGPNTNEPTGLGWTIASPRIMGKHVSKEAFGKTGFTGTMVLMDPVKQAAIVILSNRTYPKTPDDYEPMRAVWRDLADLVFAP